MEFGVWLAMIGLFLAGGLNAQNVAEAIRRVQPFGVDLCSSVRTRGQLDPVKLRAFFCAVGQAGSVPRADVGRD